MNKLKTMPEQSKKVFLNFIIPFILVIAAMVFIGSGCGSADDATDDICNPEHPSYDPSECHTSMQIKNDSIYKHLYI